jgi:hypothetical protein
MKIFGFTIARTKPTPEPLPHPVTIMDWMISQTKPRVSFHLPFDKQSAEKVSCFLACDHRGNEVTTDFILGRNEVMALQKAVAEIEKTIGREWRQKLPVFVMAEASTEV